MANRYWADRGDVDSDNDGLSDEFEERVLGTNPTLRDTDGDGLNDFRERDFGSNPLQPDSDLDGVNDYREVIVGTNPQSKDTDGDTIDDRTEIIQGTATPPDSDRNGTPDWLERNDADRDRLDDLEERWLGSKPNEEDSDFDGNEDFWEVASGGSPRSPVDDFRRLHPEIEINIQEPLPPFHPGSTVRFGFQFGDERATPRPSAELRTAQLRGAQLRRAGRGRRRRRRSGRRLLRVRLRRDERGPHPLRLMLIAPGEGTVSAGAQWGRGESVGLPLAPRGARPRRLADRRLRLSRPRHRPGGGACRWSADHPAQHRLLRRRDGDAVVGELVADPRSRRGLPVLGPHAPAHDAVVLPAAARPAGDAGVAAASTDRASGTGRVYHVVRWLCHPVVAAVIFNLAVIVSHIPGVVDASLTNGAAALRLAPPRRQHCAADVDARVRTDPRVPHRRRRQDDLPVPAVRRPDRAGRLADLRRGRRVSAVRRAARARVGAERHRRPAARRRGHEDRRLDLPVDDHRHHLVQALLGELPARARLPPPAGGRHRRSRRPRRRSSPTPARTR